MQGSPRFRVSGVACRGGGPSLMAGSGHGMLFCRVLLCVIRCLILFLTDLWVVL